MWRCSEWSTAGPCRSLQSCAAAQQRPLRHALQARSAHLARSKARDTSRAWPAMSVGASMEFSAPSSPSSGACSMQSADLSGSHCLRHAIVLTVHACCQRRYEACRHGRQKRHGTFSGLFAGLRLLRPSGLGALCEPTRAALSFMDWRELSTVLAVLTRPRRLSSAVSDTHSAAVVKSPSSPALSDIAAASKCCRERADAVPAGGTTADELCRSSNEVEVVRYPQSGQLLPGPASVITQMSSLAVTDAQIPLVWISSTAVHDDRRDAPSTLLITRPAVHNGSACQRYKQDYSELVTNILALEMQCGMSL